MFDPSNQPIIAFITSNKKRRLLVIDGFIFQQNKSTDKATYWICQEKMCDMGVHLTKNDSFIKFTKSNHTHACTGKFGNSENVDQDEKPHQL